MSIETLRIVRGILLRAFVIGVAFGLLYALMTLLGWQTWVSLVGDRWHVFDEPTFRRFTLVAFTVLRFFLVFGLLVPGLAVHWTLKREQARARAGAA